MTATGNLAKEHRIVSREEWLQARIAILNDEKNLMREQDKLSAKIRDLPWVQIDKQYTFDALTGTKSLADLFGPHNQLIVYHFMFDPTWSQGCKSCSFIADHYNGLTVHLEHRDISFVTASKAPLEMLQEFRKRMGWTFPWVSSASSDFNRDFGVSFTDQELTDNNSTYNFNRQAFAIRELPGLSVFLKDDDGRVFHTYSTYARGLEQFMAAYRFMDVTPKGRDEAETPGMGWLRHHDRYGDLTFVDPWAERPGITAPMPK